jgi:sulfate permease, SulP family
MMSQLWSRKNAGQDLRAGLVLGVESIPDGLAAGLLAGVNPVFGLYGYLFGTVAGALATSSVFMTVQATGAMAVIIADVPVVTTGPDAARALFTLSVITGLVMLALGLLRMGRLVRFIPNAVLTGFINAVAVNIVLGQLANLTGYGSDASNRVTRSIDTLVHVSSYDWPTLAIGLLTIALILLLERTRVGALALVVAVVLTSALAAVLGLASVKTLSDIATIPSTLPHPTVPDLALVPALLLPALSLALVGLVQGAAISSSMPNPDGRYPDASGDFRGQGIANIAAGVFQGMPVAGSMSATSLVTVSGARSRMANLSAGLTMAVLILTVGRLIGAIAMPALAGLLILVGIRTFKPENVAMVWRTGRTQATVMVTTFVLTLLIPLQYAVLVGVGLSVILYVASQSNRVTITRWVFDQPNGLAIEAPVPSELPAGETVVLQPYGSLFFAAAPIFEEQLPRVTPASTRSVVIIRLRGEQELGSTFITVLARYCDQLDQVGSALMLAGLGDRVYHQLEITGVLTTIGSDNVFTATPRITESLRQALTAAQAWRATRPGDSRPPG